MHLPHAVEPNATMRRFRKAHSADESRVTTLGIGLSTIIVILFFATGCASDPGSSEEGAGGTQDAAKKHDDVAIDTRADAAAPKDTEEIPDTPSVDADDVRGDVQYDVLDGGAPRDVGDITTGDVADSRDFLDDTDDTTDSTDTTDALADAPDVPTDTTAPSDTPLSDSGSTDVGTDATDANSCPPPASGGRSCLPLIHCCTYVPTGKKCQYGYECKIPNQIRTSGMWVCKSNRC